MMSDHKIVVAPDGNGWRVAVVPPVALADEPVVLLNRDIAMARARLLRLRYGFPIDAPMAARASR